MKENMEFERDDMYVDSDIQLDSENKLQIVAYLETLFDVNISSICSLIRKLANG